MALSAGQINSVFQQAYGRNASSSEISQYGQDNSLEGTSGQQQLLAQLTGGTNGAYGNSQIDQAAKIQKEIVDAYNKAQDQYNKGVSDYDKAHPFNLDDQFAKEQKNVTGSISKYYDNIMANYMQGVQQQKGNNFSQEQAFLTKSMADVGAFIGNARNMLDNTITGIARQYSNQGGAASGTNETEQGQAIATEQYNEAQTQRQADYERAQAIREYNAANAGINLEVIKNQQEQAANKQADINTTAAQYTNYDVARNNYERTLAGVGNIAANGQYQSAGAIPGKSSFETQQALQSMLPGVTSTTAATSGTSPLYAYS